MYVHSHVLIYRYVCTLIHTYIYIYVCTHSHHMQLQTYSMGREVKTHLGFVIQECKEQRITTMMNNGREIETFIDALIVILVIGIYAIGILLFSILVAVLRQQLPAIVNQSHDNTYNHYGLIWGIAITSTFVNVLILTNDILIVKNSIEREIKHPYFILVNAAIYFSLMFIGNFIFSVIITKNINMNVPGLFVIFVSPLLCGNTQRVNHIISTVVLWSILIAIQLLAAHSIFIILALLAEPEEVICMVILYTFAIFCSIHLIAVIFTLGKIHVVQKPTVGSILQGIGQGLAFTLLMVAALCIGFLITSAGELESFSPKSNSTYNTIHRFISPILLGLVGWSINSASRKWLKQIQDLQPKKKVKKRKKSKCKSPNTTMIELEERLVSDAAESSETGESHTSQRQQ